MAYLGINIGGTTCSVSRGSVGGGIEVKKSFPTTGDVQATLDGLCALARELNDESVSACGISCGGPMDAANGIVLSPPNLPGWDRIPITKLITEATGKPSFLMNDANASALAEWYAGTGGKCKGMVFLTCGTGMGAGVILDGRLFEGLTGDAGEVGHFRLTPDGPVGYHKAGSFEGWCSGGGFKQLNGVSAKEGAERARAGDAEMLAAFARFGEKLGEALALIIDAFNPARIVIGGVYMRAHDLIDAAMWEVLKREALPQSLAICEIVPSVCGDDIGDMAALSVAEYHRPDSVMGVLLKRHPALADCRADIEHAAEEWIETYERGGKLLLAGNGGSWSDAHHIAGELLKAFVADRPVTDDWTRQIDPAVAAKFERGLPAYVLGSAGAFASAFANDVDAELVYAQDLQAMGVAGDLFVGISTSGNSKNVVAAAQVAKAKGLKVMALTGRDGGELAKIADVAVRVPEDETYMVQELHLPVYHALCLAVEQHFMKS